MALQRFCLTYQDCLDVVVDVDRKIATDELLHKINGFWGGSKERLADARGDILLAVLKMLCVKVVRMSTEHFDVKGVFARQDGDTEGWPPLDGSYGITLVRYDEMEFFVDDVTVMEESRQGEGGEA